MTGDICKEIPLSRTTVNQHLKELKSAGLIKGEIEGVKVNYCLSPDTIRLMQEVLNDFTLELKDCERNNC